LAYPNDVDQTSIIRVVQINPATGGVAVASVNNEGTKTTYSAAITALAIAAAATDFFTIIGSATKTVRVTRIEISGVATAAGATTVQVLKRSAADTTGTSTAPTVVPHDSTDAAGTAVCAAYTVNPGGLGALVGLIRSVRPTFTTAAGAIPEVPVVLDFTLRNEKAVVLRGVAQNLALGLNGATVAGLTLDIDITWTEE